jgi:hypothetical protein
MGLTRGFDLERLASPPRNVDVDEEEDSRTGARPRDFVLVPGPSTIGRVAGGRVRLGLGCFVRDAGLVIYPGDADDIEVGVELMENGPGEYDVEGVEVDNAYNGAGSRMSPALSSGRVRTY